jgi:hypothetical protein
MPERIELGGSGGFFQDRKLEVTLLLSFDEMAFLANSSNSSLCGKKLFYMVPTFDFHTASENVFIFDRRVNTQEHYTLFCPYLHL